MTIWEKAVGDAMSQKLVTVCETASLAEAAHVMDANKVTGVPVVDVSGTLAGLLSQTDLIRARASQHLSQNWGGMAVSQLMTTPALTISTAASLGEAARLMKEHHVHRLVVVNDEASPIGVFSASDLVRVVADAGAGD